MALHGKKYPGPKNHITKKYPSKSHNPSHEQARARVRLSSPGGTPAGSRRPASQNEITGEVFNDPVAPPGHFKTQGHIFPTGFFDSGRTAPKHGRRVGRNTSPGTPRRVGRFRAGAIPVDVLRKTEPRFTGPPVSSGIPRDADPRFTGPPVRLKPRRVSRFRAGFFPSSNPNPLPKRRKAKRKKRR